MTSYFKIYCSIYFQPPVIGSYFELSLLLLMSFAKSVNKDGIDSVVSRNNLVGG